MNTYLIYGLIALLIIVAGIVVYKHPELISKKTIEKVEDVAKVADEGLTEVQKILPNNPTVNALAELREWIKIAVGNSEQDARNGKITKGQRFDNAMAVASNVAKDLGIELDENKEMQISAAINNFCNELGHAPTNVKAIQDELEKAKADLLSANTKASELETDKANALATIENISKEKEAVETQLKAIQGAVTGLTKETATSVQEQPTTTTP